MSDAPSSNVVIPPVGLAGTLDVPKNPTGLIIFVHGSGSSHLSPRNIAVAKALNRRGFATFLFDLLTPIEETDRAKVFDIPLLAERLAEALRWVVTQDSVIGALPIGLFGASTGAAAALVVAARLSNRIKAVVSRGGRPDLAIAALSKVNAPTLLVVGGADLAVIKLNEEALAHLHAPKALEIVADASHLFPEPGPMDAVIEHAARWFDRYVAQTRT